jgi:cell division protein FtsA
MVFRDITAALRKNKDQEQPLVVALDVGTEYVKALIGQVTDDGLEVIGVGRQRQSLSDMHSGAIADIAGVVENCESALLKAEEMAGVSGRDSVLGIAGELVRGGTTTIKYRREDPNEPLEINELENIMEQIRSRAAERTRAELAWESGNPDLEVRLVNSALVGIEIDGTKVTNPVGFQGGDVAIQLFTAFAPLIHIGALERVSAEVDLNLISLSAEPYAVARSVTKSEADNSFSAICIDVGGGTTDIAVINDGGVVGTKMFGIGGRAFTSSVAQEFDIDFDRAEAMKLRSNNVTDPDDDEQRVLDTLEATLDVWVDGVILALEEFDELEHLPQRILLCGGGSGLNQLVERLEESGWYEELPFAKQPSVDHISPQQVVGVSDATGNVADYTFITAMGLLKIGSDTLNVSGASETWKDRVNRVLSI